jgi:hypothetical protein
MRESGADLKVILVALLFLHLVVHPLGHSLFNPAVTLPQWESSPDHDKESEPVQGEEDCRLCRSASSLLPAPVSVVAVGPAEAPHKRPVPTSLPRTLYSKGSLAPRAPPSA